MIVFFITCEEAVECLGSRLYWLYSWYYLTIEKPKRKVKTMIQDAMFTSVWDDGFEIHSKCKVNTETKEAFDIETIDVSDYDIDICTDEYITLLDGKQYDVYTSIRHCSFNNINDEYWYN